MGKIIFFTGGSRSGKSKFAEEYIYEQKYKNKIYFATAIAFDNEMQDRIERHIKRRGNTWKTIEGFKDLISLVKNDIDSTDVILFDCITNFVSNFMIMDRDIDWDKVELSVVQEIEDQIEEEMSNFLEFIKSKKLLRGATCSAGELGQTSIDYNGRLGHYGNRGSLEDYIGNKELAADARSMYASHGQDKTIVDCNPITLEKAALNGDQIALKIWNDIARKLACSLINCCYLFNPEVIVIGGGVSKAKALLFDPLQTFMREQMPEPLVKHLQIIPAMFGTEAGIIGAARLARDTFSGETNA